MIWITGSSRREMKERTRAISWRKKPLCLLPKGSTAPNVRSKLLEFFKFLKMNN